MTWIAVLILLISADFEKPQLNLAAQQVQIHLPEPLLADVEVERRLLSGLTTSIIIETEARDASGAAFNDSMILEIRYDLWEEQLSVAQIAASGEVNQQVYGSLLEFIEAMRLAPLNVMMLADPAHSLVSVRTRVRVIPYSQSEEDAAVTWLGDVLTAPAEASDQQDRGRRRTTGDSSSGSEIFQVLMTTGLKREAVVDLRWKWRWDAGSAAWR